MKILWITNVPFAHHNAMLGRPNAVVAGGAWLNAAYDAVKSNDNIELHILTSYDITEYAKERVGNVTFHIAPGGNIRSYDYSSDTNRNILKSIKQEILPDIVVIWGTESRLAHLASYVFNDKPIIVYIQGVISSIFHHYYDGVPDNYKCRTLRDYFDKFNSHSLYNNFKKQTDLETDILNNAVAAIVENDWCEEQCLMINPQIKIFRNQLPIKKEYFNHTWNIEKIERHSIFTNAGGYPIKGHHILFQALALVKNVYPDFKLYIPGNDYVSYTKSVKRSNGYSRFINKIIKDNELERNIVFVGILNARQMAECIQRCNVYVMPSVCENHSSSLIEAMIVGAPCVSSLVGGVADLIENKTNGLIYNSTDYVSLAGRIVKLFQNDDLAQSLSMNCELFRTKRKTDFGKEMNDIYTSIFLNENGII